MRQIIVLKKELIYASIILTTCFIIPWYLIDYYFTNLPDYIPHTNIKINGFVVIIVLIAVMYFFQKKCIQKIPDISLLQVTGLSALVCVSAEIVFQAIRQLVERDTFLGKVFWLLHATIVSSLLSVTIAFFVALETRHPKSIWNRVVPILFLIILFLLKKFTTILPENLWVSGQDN